MFSHSYPNMPWALQAFNVACNLSIDFILGLIFDHKKFLITVGFSYNAVTLLPSVTIRNVRFCSAPVQSCNEREVVNHNVTQYFIARTLEFVLFQLIIMWGMQIVVLPRNNPDLNMETVRSPE